MIFLVEDEGRTFIVVAKSLQVAREALSNATYIVAPDFEEYGPRIENPLGVVIEAVEGTAVLYP